MDYIPACFATSAAKSSSRFSIPSPVSKRTNALILIGPEGDFSPEEVEQAIACGFQPVMLGQSRLRTETAGVVACHTIQVLNQLKSK